MEEFSGLISIPDPIWNIGLGLKLYKRLIFVSIYIKKKYDLAMKKLKERERRERERGKKSPFTLIRDAIYGEIESKSIYMMYKYVFPFNIRRNRKFSAELLKQELKCDLQELWALHCHYFLYWETDD